MTIAWGEDGDGSGFCNDGDHSCQAVQYGPTAETPSQALMHNDIAAVRACGQWAVAPSWLQGPVAAAFSN